MTFPNWESNDEKHIYKRYLSNNRAALVGRFDGWDWGWMIIAIGGSIESGQLNSRLDIFDCIKAVDSMYPILHQ